MVLPAQSLIRDDAERLSPVLPHCVWVLAAPVRGHNNSRRDKSAGLILCSQCCTEARGGPLEGAAARAHKCYLRKAGWMGTALNSGGE